MFKLFLRTATVSVILLAAIPSLADQFWAHGIVKLIDVAYGEDPQQTMDVFLHGDRTGEPNYFAPDPEPRPTLVWIHGGGWVGGDKAAEISQLIPYLQKGWNVFNLNYRQGSDTAPQAADDVMCAYQAIVARLEKSGNTQAPIVVSGASAGGHLALVVGLLNSTGKHKCRSPRKPAAIVNWFGITDIEMVDEYLEQARPEQNYARNWAGSAAKVAEVSALYSPLYLISDNAPAIITIHGDKDSVVPFDQAESLHASLTTPNELLMQAGGNHSGFTDKQYKAAYTAIFKFLDIHTRHKR
ncbi:MAG: alpha/beta hydrolase [Pseudomonadaceae bacterium]|nr:alpha/beta hydrolase [Pseudomonadaceae bacterium]